jgi:hypothetical protein
MGKSLDTILEKIKNYKSRYYIGTSEAYELVQCAQRITENPRYIADRINEIVADKIKGELTCRAVPENVTGLFFILQKIYSYAFLKMVNKFNEYSKDNVWVREKLGGVTEFGLGSMFGQVIFDNLGDRESLWITDKPDTYVSAYSPYFSKANKEEIGTEDFPGYSQAAHAQKLLKLKREAVKNTQSQQDKDFFSAYFNAMASIAKRLDWGKCMSAERHNSEESSLLSEMYDKVDVNQIAKRIVNDKVENRAEYRRMVVIAWLYNKECKSFEDAAALIERSHRDASARNKKLKKLCAPQIILENDTTLLCAYNYILDAVRKDKNFIERFLRS